MKWNSPWGWGFPGWHIECSAMSTKYLGTTFDIHGGGMDLQATHHTNEIAQSQACNAKHPVKYWMHTNMLTVNGVRMSKSAGNGFLPMELFTGSHPLLERGYSPMAVRFFMAQTHYRSTLDFSNEALQAAEKGYLRLMKAIEVLPNLKTSEKSSVNIEELKNSCYEAMNDDFNSPVLIANLFEAVRIINSVNDGKETLNNVDLELLKKLMNDFVFEVLGLKNEQQQSDSKNNILKNVVDLVLNIRMDAKQNKDFATSDKIRNALSELGIVVKDKKDGFEWEIKEN
jgi:cysteinyl-tRNA synthetase